MQESNFIHQVYLPLQEVFRSGVLLQEVLSGLRGVFHPLQRLQESHSAPQLGRQLHVPPVHQAFPQQRQAQLPRAVRAQHQQALQVRQVREELQEEGGAPGARGDEPQHKLQLLMREMWEAVLWEEEPRSAHEDTLFG